MHPEENSQELAYHQTQRWVHSILVSLMLLLMVVSIIQLGEYIFPSWNGDYLIWLSLFVSIEAQYSKRMLDHRADFKEKVLYRLAEWVVLIVGIKLLIYLMRGFGSFLTDLKTWSDDFLMTFFSGEYLFSLVVILSVWTLATFLSTQLYHLEGEQKLLEIERESRMTIFRKEVRDSLAATILVIGLLMTIGATFILLNDRHRGIESSGSPFKMMHVLVFFILGLVLLSLTQFSILRVRWFLDRVPIQNNLVLRWVVFSLGLLLFVAMVSFVLPTRYSTSALEFLNVLLSIVLWILWGIAVLFTLPLVYLLSLIFRLMGRSEDQVEGLQSIVPKMPEQPGPAHSGWGDWIKDLLFWSIFLLIIIFSLITILRQNQSIMNKLHNQRIITWLRRLFLALFGFFTESKIKIQAVIQEQRERFQSRGRGSQFSLGKFINPHRLSPRDQVIFYYLALIRRGQEHGIPRAPTQTPDEYRRLLDASIPEAALDFNTITENFMVARYSRKPIDEESARVVEKTWARLKKVIKKITTGNLRE
jgi:hypothetical protein